MDDPGLQQSVKQWVRWVTALQEGDIVLDF